MAEDRQGKGPLSEGELQEMVASSDGGARNPTGAVAMLLPSGEYTTARTGPACPVSVSSSLPEEASHILTAPS